MNAVIKYLIHANIVRAALAGMMICTATPHAYGLQTLFEKDQQVVAIDPGHGGNDTGAKGPNGVLEKTVTLKLARMIARQLEGDYRVVLARNDDYGLEYSSRTAAANHAKADMFVSLHTGSSFIHDINRTVVYYYLPFQGSALTTEPGIAQDHADSQPVVSWRMIQSKYRTASENLANQMRSRLTVVWPPQDLAVQGIPLRVLEGADMPSVAIEIGNLANANAEKALADPQVLARIAGAIASAITAFLSEKTP